MWRKLVAAALCTIALGAAAHAEVNEVRMSKQFGLPYLPMIVIEAQTADREERRGRGSRRGQDLMDATWRSGGRT